MFKTQKLNFHIIFLCPVSGQRVILDPGINYTFVQIKVVTDSCLSEARVPDFNGEKKGMT